LACGINKGKRNKTKKYIVHEQQHHHQGSEIHVSIIWMGESFHFSIKLDEGGI
jgi:hypothetical protein